MRKQEEDMFAINVLRELNNASSNRELDFNIHQLMFVGSYTLGSQPTIIISPDDSWRNIVAKCFAQKGEVYVSYSESYLNEAKNVVDAMNRRAERALSPINPNLPYHFSLSEIII